MPGWITLAIPRLIAYCSQFPESLERVYLKWTQQVAFSY